MALTASLSLVSPSMGRIEGALLQKGREGQIAVLASNHEVVSPHDPATGHASGKRLHEPLVLTKEIDQATPKLYRLLTLDEALGEFTLRFWVGGKTKTSALVPRMSLRLTGARLVAMRFAQPYVLDPTQANWPETEELSFLYQRIEWRWEATGEVAADDWMPG